MTDEPFCYVCFKKENIIKSCKNELCAGRACLDCLEKQYIAGCKQCGNCRELIIADETRTLDYRNFLILFFPILFHFDLFRFSCLWFFVPIIRLMICHYEEDLLSIVLNMLCIASKLFAMNLYRHINGFEILITCQCIFDTFCVIAHYIFHVAYINLKTIDICAFTNALIALCFSLYFTYKITKNVCTNVKVK